MLYKHSPKEIPAPAAKQEDCGLLTCHQAAATHYPWVCHERLTREGLMQRGGRRKGEAAGGRAHGPPVTQRGALLGEQASR